MNSSSSSKSKITHLVRPLLNKPKVVETVYEVLKKLDSDYYFPIDSFDSLKEARRYIKSTAGAGKYVISVYQKTCARLEHHILKEDKDEG